MGKGDKKTRRGKITMGSYGVKRPRKKSIGYKPTIVKAKKVVEIPETPVAIPAPPKKVAPKKETVAKVAAPKKETTAKTAAPKKAAPKKATEKKAAAPKKAAAKKKA